MKFRKDINGLRAIAVIGVVLFHFNANWLPGGFAGVDVFFIISGFLMTGIIFNTFEDRGFNIFSFYLSRAKRIIPALTTVCLSILVFGYFFTLDVTFKTISEHALSSVTFISNIVYWKETSYFSASAHEKWLLHTWSLSVEWQFYLLYPIAILILKQFFSKKLTANILVLLALGSFALSVYATFKWPSPAYYLLPTRAWEMLLGGIAFLYPLSLKKGHGKLLGYLGLVLIVGSYFIFTSEDRWPGYLAFIPAIGSYLVIIANLKNNIITNNKCFQYIGKWSYSIYLWHWPLVVLMYTYMEKNIINQISLVFTSVVLGVISYEIIEKKSSLKTLILSSLITIILSITVIYNNGHFTFREKSLDVRNEIINTYKNYTMDPSGLFDKCNSSIRILKTAKPELSEECIASKSGGIFLWGDSHLASISTGLRKILGNQIPFSQLASSSCEPSFMIKKRGLDRFAKGCNYSNDIALDSLKKSQPRVVILAISSKHKLLDWSNTIDKLKNIGVEKIIIIGPLPQWKPSLPAMYVRKHMGEEYIADPQFDTSLIEENNFMKKLAQTNKQFTYIDILSNLCTNLETKLPTCRAKINDTLITFDYGHLTVEGSEYIANQFIINEIR